MKRIIPLPDNEITFITHNIRFNLLLSGVKRASEFSVFLLFFFLAGSGFAQINDYQGSDPSIAALIQKVEIKAKKTKTVALTEYQSNFKRIVEFEGQNKTSIEVYEEYCLKNEKTLCRIVLIEKNGIPVNVKKIEKDRRKVAKTFIKSDASNQKEDPFGYGISINSLWVDPVIYLRACRISSSSEIIIEGRRSVLVRVNECNIEGEAVVLKNQIQYMLRTNAEILIDVSDESVVQMKVFPGKEFVAFSKQNNPVIITENVRMKDGFWLSKRIRLETVGYKEVFPNLKDNLEFDFFDYRNLTVNVKASKIMIQ